jgi:hypothetical protein
MEQLSKSGVLNHLVPPYPQIKIVPLWVPPNQYALRVPPKSKILPKMGIFWAFFIYFAYPLWPSHVPLEVRVAQVENRWSKYLIFNLKSGYSFISVKN